MRGWRPENSSLVILPCSMFRKAAHPDLDTELSCVDPDTKKPGSLGSELVISSSGPLNLQVVEHG